MRHPTNHPPSPLNFTSISDYPKVRELPTGCGLQSSPMPSSIPISFQSGAKQCAGVRSYALSMWTNDLAKFWANPETIALYYTPSNNSGR
jgi:hypothetical protein